MSIAIPGETVTLIITGTPTGKDEDHNLTYSPTETPCSGAVFSPGGSTENVQGGDTVTTSPTFRWVGTVPNLTAVDKIRRANGDLYEVTGEPADHDTPGFTRVLAVQCKRVTG